MAKVTCPKCGEVFTVDENVYKELLSQIKDDEFNKELNRRLEEAKRQTGAEFVIAIISGNFTQRGDISVIDKWDKETITNKINNFLDNFTNITPKSYTITITNKNDITESIEIKNITKKVNKDIISDIINDEKSDLLKDNKITYKYLN